MFQENLDINKFFNFSDGFSSTDFTDKGIEFRLIWVVIISIETLTSGTRLEVETTGFTFE